MYYDCTNNTLLICKIFKTKKQEYGLAHTTKKNVLSQNAISKA